MNPSYIAALLIPGDCESIWARSSMSSPTDFCVFPPSGAAIPNTHKMETTRRTAQNVRRLSVGIIGVAQSEQTPTETCKFPTVVIDHSRPDQRGVQRFAEERCKQRVSIPWRKWSVH